MQPLMNSAGLNKRHPTPDFPLAGLISTHDGRAESIHDYTITSIHLTFTRLHPFRISRSITTTHQDVHLHLRAPTFTNSRAKARI